MSFLGSSPVTVISQVAVLEVSSEALAVMVTLPGLRALMVPLPCSSKDTMFLSDVYQRQPV